MSRGIVLTLVVVFAAVVCGCIDYRQANDAAVEKLRQRLIDEDFDEIYRNTSTVTQAQLPRDEFAERMKEVSNELKSIDPTVNWKSTLR